MSGRSPCVGEVLPQPAAIVQIEALRREPFAVLHDYAFPAVLRQDDVIRRRIVAHVNQTGEAPFGQRGLISLWRNNPILDALGRVVAALSRGPRSDLDAVKIAALTPKERRIIAVVLKEKGARNKVIAEKLHMSEHTLHNNLTTI